MHMCSYLHACAYTHMHYKHRCVYLRVKEFVEAQDNSCKL